MNSVDITDFKLSDEAVMNFDVEFRDLGPYMTFIKEQLGSNSYNSYLDIGGGNGMFADQLAKAVDVKNYTVLDNSKAILDQNKEYEGKKCVLGSATDLGSVITDQKFDIITINVLLHHLVLGSSEECKQLVIKTLQDAKKLLNPGGVIFVYEQVYIGFPLCDPGRRIFNITKIKNPMIVKYAKKFGANTAGVGVHFRSESNWVKCFKQAGFDVNKSKPFLQDIVTKPRMFFLGMKQCYSAAFALR